LIKIDLVYIFLGSFNLSYQCGFPCSSASQQEHLRAAQIGYGRQSRMVHKTVEKEFVICLGGDISDFCVRSDDNWIVSSNHGLPPEASWILQTWISLSMGEIIFNNIQCG